MISGDQFNATTGSHIAQFQTTTKQNNLLTMSLARVMLAASSTQSGMVFQSLDVNGGRIIRRHSPAPSTPDECRCSVAFSCRDPMYLGDQSLCHKGDNCTAGAWAVPGVVSSCTTFETLFDSDLRCFFNRTCLNILLSKYNVSIPNRSPLPQATLAINVLSDSTSSLFAPNDTIGTIYKQLMIEEWKVVSDYQGYYAACAPPTCTYTISRRADYLYVASTLVAVFGGLSVTFRLLVPLVVRLIHGIQLRRQQRHNSISRRRLGKLS